MQTPTLHLNGTSARELCETYCQAMRAVTEAMDETAKTGPNGRDYYPQGPQAFEAARAEHYARMQRLEAVRAELEALAVHCAP